MRFEANKGSTQAMSPRQVGGQFALSASAPSWSTGIEQCDEWLRTNIVDEEVLISFSEIPIKTEEPSFARQSKVRKTIRWLGLQLA